MIWGNAPKILERGTSATTCPLWSQVILLNGEDAADNTFFTKNWNQTFKRHREFFILWFFFVRGIWFMSHKVLVYMFEQSLSNISHKYRPGLRKNEQTRTMTCIGISQGACALWDRKFAWIGSSDVTENIVTLPNLGYYVPRKWHVLNCMLPCQ